MEEDRYYDDYVYGPHPPGIRFRTTIISLSLSLPPSLQHLRASFATEVMEEHRYYDDYVYGPHPPGIRFTPKDEQLIVYLTLKDKGE
ncbi:hypothetical protein BHM03_00055434 [Ensete ventricosum]|nr:hypothetical protein BHM03_00055434 [Ensete ventricosum]